MNQCAFQFPEWINWLGWGYVIIIALLLSGAVVFGLSAVIRGLWRYLRGKEL